VGVGAGARTLALKKCRGVALQNPSLSNCMCGLAHSHPVCLSSVSISKRGRDFHRAPFLEDQIPGSAPVFKPLANTTRRSHFAFPLSLCTSRGSRSLLLLLRSVPVETHGSPVSRCARRSSSWDPGNDGGDQSTEHGLTCRCSRLSLATLCASTRAGHRASR
jgi:hypothetical protein